MGFKSFMRSVAALTFALLLVALARPALAQSDQSDQKQPTLQLSPGELDFGSVTVGETSATQTETATNPATNHKKIKVHSISASAGFTITDNTCTGSTLRDGQSCTIDVACAPTAPGAITGGTLTYSYKTNKDHTATASLTCTGVTGPTATPTTTATPTGTATSTPTSTATATATNTATATSTATSSSTPNATIWILTVYTGHGAVSVTINGATSTCLPGHIATPCSYNVPNRKNVDVTAPTSGNAFTAPAACTTTGPDCEFIMTTNTAVRLVGS